MLYLPWKLFFSLKLLYISTSLQNSCQPHLLIMDSLQCEQEGCNGLAEFVCILDKQRICGHHYSSHRDSPGRHSLNKLFKELSASERLAVHRTIYAITQAAHSAVVSEIQRMHKQTQQLREEIRQVEQACASQVQNILAESRAKIAKLKRVSETTASIFFDEKRLC